MSYKACSLPRRQERVLSLETLTLSLNEKNKGEDDAYSHHYCLRWPWRLLADRVKQDQISGMNIVSG